jgi:hypothetical protein
MFVVLGASGPGATVERFPVAGAQKEFAALGPHVRGYCHPIEGDVEAFRRAVLPFGPMDLSVTKSDKADARILRDLYLGFVGAICRVDAGALVGSFDCGAQCVDYRQRQLGDRLDEISRVVDAFRGLSQVEVISEWGIPGEFRVNNVFSMMGQVNESIPSKRFGFVPSEEWKAIPDIDSYLSSRHVDKSAFESVLGKMYERSLAAIVREGEWIRVVRMGIGLKESGLLFLDKGARVPTIGTQANDGRKYAVVKVLRNGVVFYETE